LSLVLDSSATLAFFHADESAPAIQTLFDQVGREGAWVPGLWRLEVGNVLEMGVRRGRYDDAFRRATLADLDLLPIRTDIDTDRYAWGEIARLASRHRLSLYDASYLELARRLTLPLATLDNALRGAALNDGVRLIGV